MDVCRSLLTFKLFSWNVLSESLYYGIIKTVLLSAFTLGAVNITDVNMY